MKSTISYYEQKAEKNHTMVNIQDLRAPCKNQGTYKPDFWQVSRDGGHEQLISHSGRYDNEQAFAKRDEKQAMIDLRGISTNWFSPIELEITSFWIWTLTVPNLFKKKTRLGHVLRDQCFTESGSRTEKIASTKLSLLQVNKPCTFARCPRFDDLPAFISPLNLTSNKKRSQCRLV